MGRTMRIQLPWEGDPDPLWTALRARGEATVAELWEVTGQRSATIHAALHDWVRAGLVKLHDGKPARFTW